MTAIITLQYASALHVHVPSRTFASRSATTIKSIRLRRAGAMLRTRQGQIIHYHDARTFYDARLHVRYIVVLILHQQVFRQNIVIHHHACSATREERFIGAAYAH